MSTARDLQRVDHSSHMTDADKASIGAKLAAMGKSDNIKFFQ